MGDNTTQMACKRGPRRNQESYSCDMSTCCHACTCGPHDALQPCKVQCTGHKILNVARQQSRLVAVDARSHGKTLWNPDESPRTH
eukprot:scaffold268069_cov35-Tisochrysis_lutea.AAC.2